MRAPIDLRERIAKKIEGLTTEEAIEKLNGYFRQYYWNNHLRIKMGELYLEQSDWVKAGKMLYFKDNLDEREERAVTRFIESCNANKLLIFNELVRYSKLPVGIDLNMSSKIFDLILQISKQEGALPKGIVGWIWNFERVRSIEIWRGWVQNYTGID